MNWGPQPGDFDSVQSAAGVWDGALIKRGIGIRVKVHGQATSDSDEDVAHRIGTKTRVVGGNGWRTKGVVQLN